MFFWNASGNAPDDGGLTTIVPTGSAAGEWTRIGSSPPHTELVPPAFGAGLQGVIGGGTNFNGNANSAGIRLPFSVPAIFTMTIGTPNWFDFSIEAIGGGYSFGLRYWVHRA